MRYTVGLGTAILLLCWTGTTMRVPRSWTDKPLCDTERDPEWPLAYSKYRGQQVEGKGRTSDNLQDDRHSCDRRGVHSKCHICEDIECGENMDTTCAYQLQGVNSSSLATNIPTTSDTPWAVGGAHRNDFGNASTSRVCVMLSGGHCIRPFGKPLALEQAPVA
ncbi:unnamed protein product [Discosporangium mesarthrocarpum]